MKSALGRAASHIRHPGVEKKRAKEHGISTHEQLVRDSHSSNKTLRARGNLGLALAKSARRRAKK